WHQYSGLNATSLGIEIVNLGYPAADELLPSDARRWQSYTPAQIAAVGALSRDLVTRYQIPATHVLAHSDIAPDRKQDPGPHFPWRQLYLEYGIGAWPDEARVVALLASPLPTWDAAMWQQQLARYGYDLQQTGLWDEPSQAVIRAFERHFCPAKVDGLPSRRCQATLMALLEKYYD
ncbi:MAG: N-acetylmuramoyl-L-alanine amidase, partial [Aeromonas sp.]